MKKGLLLVDDDETILLQMKWAFSKEFTVYSAVDRSSAMEKIRTGKIAVVTLDLGLPPTPWDTEEGFLTLSEISAFDPSIKVIVITGNTQKEFALKSVSLGAFDFYLKPINIEEIKHTVKRAFNIRHLEQENISLQKKLKHAGDMDIVGSSSSILQIFRMIDQVAPTDTSVLITGESGTGKELVAKSIWQKSLRKDGPFMPINCGAIPETLLESELFGYEKGAFTGANKTKKGLIELAGGGTLFLDEIGEMPFSLQVNLLRFLQEKKIRRIGGNKQISVDVRVLAATNKDLKQEIQAGRFRDDLYFRLVVISIDMPPLRVREGDVLLLAKYFLEKFCLDNKKAPKRFDEKAKAALLIYDWPGNIRELENKVKRGVVLAESDSITAEDMDLIPGRDVTLLPEYNEFMPLKKAKEQFEKEFLKRVIEKHNRNITNAAKELETTRQNLHHLIAKYNL